MRPPPLLPALLMVALLVAAPAAQAQTGPTAPRVVEVTVPMAPVNPERKKVGVSAAFELAVGADGRVASVRVVKSSGDRKFDVVLIKFYRKWRLVPAIDARGNPTTGVLRIAYDQPADRPARSDFRASNNGREAAEKDRINRMKCKDFVWEYARMQEIARKHSVDNEEMLRVAFGMYLARYPEYRDPGNKDKLSRLLWAHRPAIAGSLEECRSNPAKAFWSGVFEPQLTKHFKKGSRPPGKRPKR